MGTQVCPEGQQGGNVKPGVNPQQVEGIGHVGHPGSGHWEARLIEGEEKGAAAALHGADVPGSTC